jgi:Lysozyme inhibitor LprI
MIRHSLLLITICLPFALAIGERPGTREALLRDEADAELNRAYKGLMATLTPQKQVALRDEERAWIKSRDEEASRRAHGSAVGGSAYRVDYLNALTDLIRKRTAELRSRLTEGTGKATFDATMPPPDADTSSVSAPSTAAPAEDATATAQATPSGGFLVTPGAERFVMGGISVGAPPLEVVRFLASKGLHPTGQREWSYARGDKTIQKIDYVAKESYTNGKIGLEELQVSLSFTPPFPTPRGVVSLVYEISYDTHYGEGVSVAEVKADLKKRYGEPTSEADGFPNPFLAWRPPNINASAFIIPAPNPGTVGTLRLGIRDNGLFNAGVARAKAHLDQLDAERNKDTTKPSF